jgi:hypothetical protein
MVCYSALQVWLRLFQTLWLFLSATTESYTTLGLGCYYRILRSVINKKDKP